jgi:L-aspartate oxidase
VVARAIVAEMGRTGTTWMYLDLTHLPPDFLRERFPKIFETCRRYGLDLTRDQLPVSPAVHYIMGGVRSDPSGRTSVAGLYAAGEVACTGVHGANRLASNSLLEGLVFGARAGLAALNDSLQQPERSITAPVEFDLSRWRLDRRTKARVQEIMWRKAGLIRRADEMKDAIEEFGKLTEEGVNQRTKNFVTLAKLMVEAALWRKESRGGHYRADFPHRDDKNWHIHSAQQIGWESVGSRQ